MATAETETAREPTRESTPEPSPEIGPMESESTGVRRALKKLFSIESLLPNAIMLNDQHELLAMSREATRKQWGLGKGQADESAEGDDMGIRIGDDYYVPQPAPQPQQAQTDTSTTSKAGTLAKWLVGAGLLTSGGIGGAAITQIFGGNDSPPQQQFEDTDTDTRYELELVD